MKDATCCRVRRNITTQYSPCYRRHFARSLEWQFSSDVDDYAHKCICANGQYVCCFLSNKYMGLPGRTLQRESVYRKYLLLNSITNADYTQDLKAYRCPAELNICWGWLIAYIVLIDKHVNSPHKGPVTRKIFPFDGVIMNFEYVTANSCLTLQMPIPNIHDV